MSADASPLAVPGFDQLLDAVPLGLVLLDRAGCVVFCNAAAQRLGCAGAEARGRDFFDGSQTHPELQSLQRAYRTAMAADADLDEHCDVTVAGSDAPAHVHVRLRRVVIDGQPFGMLIADDDSRLKHAARALSTALGQAQDQAGRDALTSLFNRRHFEAALPGELKRAERLGTPLSLLMVDVDRFKLLNDTHGHPVGDQVLVELGRVMGRVLRVGDTCARLGGEEFCAILPHTDSGAALHAAERIHRVVRALRLKEIADLRITVSIGVSTTTGLDLADTAGCMKKLMGMADAALYDAKKTGRNRTVLSSGPA